MKIRFVNGFGTIGAAALLVTALSGCSSTGSEMEPQGLAPGATPATPQQAGPSPAEIAEQRKREQMLAVSVFHFDFDKSDLKPETLEPLRYHADRLKSNPSMRVRLEGHADERGSREYNQALGERRALAVQRYLQVQGVNARQMEVISYGEERPAVNASGEQAWSSNRRVELVF